jgi:hypothetical protein
MAKTNNTKSVSIKLKPKTRQEFVMPRVFTGATPRRSHCLSAGGGCKSMPLVA